MQTLADGIYFYRLIPDQKLLLLTSWRGLPANLSPYIINVPLGERERQWLLSLTDSEQIESGAWQDWRLERLPEFARNRFAAAFILPLLMLPQGHLAGLLTVARLKAGGFNSLEKAALSNLRTPLTSVLRMAASHEENARLKLELRKATDRLAARTQIERAKGIIQNRRGCTEEEAYLHLRRISRTTRKPMGEIARSVISTAGN